MEEELVYLRCKSMQSIRSTRCQRCWQSSSKSSGCSRCRECSSSASSRYSYSTKCSGSFSFSFFFMVLLKLHNRASVRACGKERKKNHAVSLKLSKHKKIKKKFNKIKKKIKYKNLVLVCFKNLFVKFCLVKIYSDEL